MRLAGLILLILCALNAGCSDSASPPREPRASIRDLRYCEIAFFYVSPEDITSETYNSFRLNDCPQFDWDSIDFAAETQQIGATLARPNGPRRWTMDTAELAGSDEAPRRFFGNLEFREVANIQLEPGNLPTGDYYVDAMVKRDSRFEFFRGQPVYTLEAPLGKSYVMQSYAQYVDSELNLADLDSLESKISLPEGWFYRTKTLEEDLEVEDFQGFATALRDPLANTYQRAANLEYLTDEEVAVELLNSSTMQSWTAYMTSTEADQLELSTPWEIGKHIMIADKSVYHRSPNAVLSGRFDSMALADTTFYHSASRLCDPELHSSGLIVTNQSRRFQELTYTSGRTVNYIVNHLGKKFVLVSQAPGGVDFQNSLPSGWRSGQLQLSDEWRVTFEDVIETVETVDGARVYQGPVLLPQEAAPVSATQIFTHKMIKPTGENPFAQLAYECSQCTFDQQASIEAPPGWSKGPTQLVLATGELRSRPCGMPSSVDFLPRVSGNEYELIARPLDGKILEFGEQGLVILIDVERDTVLRFPAGRRVHELTNPEGDVYVMFAYEVDSMDAKIADFDRPDALDGHPIPTGWTYSSRILRHELVLDSPGVVPVLTFRGSGPLSTWEKR